MRGSHRQSHKYGSHVSHHQAADTGLYFIESKPTPKPSYSFCCQYSEPYKEEANFAGGKPIRKATAKDNNLAYHIKLPPFQWTPGIIA